MSDYRYYASESTLRSLNDNIETLNDNIVSYSENFILIFLTIAIILSVKFIEEFIDTLVHNKKR